MDKYCLITHSSLKKIKTKYSKLLINDFLNFDGKISNHKTVDRNIFYKMPTENEMINLSKLKEKILIELSNILNKELNQNYSLRYWRIVCGYYVDFVINVTYERWHTIEEILKKEQVKSAPSIEYDIENGFIDDVYHFGYLASNNDDFNHFLYSKAIKYQNEDLIKNNIVKEKIDLKNCVINHNKKFFKQQINLGKQSIFDRIQNFLIKNNIEKINLIFSKLNRLYLNIFTNIYLLILFVLRKKLKLILLINSLNNEEKNKIYKNKGIPKLNFDYIRFSILRSKKSKYDFENRKKIFKKKINSSEKNFLYYLWEILIYCLPLNYLENHQNIQKFFNKFKYSFKVEKIFLSGARSEDGYNMWVANKVNNENTKLIICQQGGGPGSDKYNVWQNQDVKISDRYFSYGWKNQINKITPIGVFNTDIPVFKPGTTTQNRDKCVLIGYNLAKFSFLYEGSRPRSPLNLNHLDAQMRLYENLDISIKNNTIVRLKPFFDDVYSKFLWKKKFKTINISDERGKFVSNLNESKLNIVTYNASTPLQSIYSNIPTIIFLDKRFYSFSNELNYFFRKFEDLGVFFQDDIEAARQVNKIWNNSFDWWYSNEIQDLRVKFCEKFFKYPGDLNNVF